MLHVKITICRDLDTKEGVGIGGVFIIASELNDLYSGWKTEQEWRKICHSKVIDDKDVYFEILKDFLLYCVAVNHKFFSISELCVSSNDAYGLNWTRDNDVQIFSEIKILWENARDIVIKEAKKQFKKDKKDIVLYKLLPFVEAVTIDEGYLITIKVQGQIIHLFYRKYPAYHPQEHRYLPRPFQIPKNEEVLKNEQMWLYIRDDKKAERVFRAYFYDELLKMCDKKEFDKRWFKPSEIIKLDDLGDYRKRCYKK